MQIVGATRSTHTLEVVLAELAEVKACACAQCWYRGDIA